jgi:hypothetical protein
MTTDTLTVTKTAPATFDPAPVSVRITISALWASMLFVFAYVDIFSLMRPDYRAEVEAGRAGGFSIDQTFLLWTTAYVVIPALMVVAVLVLRPRANRILNLALSSVYALTIVGAAIGEWQYYLLGSVVEVVLLAAIAYYAWTWPRATPSAAADRTTDARTETAAVAAGEFPRH